MRKLGNAESYDRDGRALNGLEKYRTKIVRKLGNAESFDRDGRALNGLEKYRTKIVQGGHHTKTPGGPADRSKVDNIWSGTIRGGPAFTILRYQLVRHWTQKYSSILKCELDFRWPGRLHFEIGGPALVRHLVSNTGWARGGPAVGTSTSTSTTTNLLHVLQTTHP